MSHLAAALLFAFSLLAALVAIHMTVRLHWEKIVAALHGELGREIRPAGAPAYARRRAAF